MLRTLQIVVLALSSVLLIAALAVVVGVVGGYADAEQPLSAIAGSAMIGVPMGAAVLALIAALRPTSRLRTHTILLLSIILESTLAATLLIVAGKAWRDGLFGYVAACASVAILAFGTVALLVPTFQALEQQHTDDAVS